MARQGNQITILKLIKENCDILFGQFLDTLTRDVKEGGWKNIITKCHAMSVLPLTQDWKYLRDTTWQNWRKRTIEKKDNKKKTGTGGGKTVQYDEADLLILDIIVKDSPNLDGLDIPESSGTNEPSVAHPVLPDPSTESDPNTLDTADAGQASAGSPIPTEGDHNTQTKKPEESQDYSICREGSIIFEEEENFKRN